MVKLKSRKVLVRIAVIVLIFLIVCTFLSKTVYTANLPRVTVAYPATQAEVKISASAAGEVVYDVTVAQFDVPLKVVKVDVAPGDPMAADDVVLEVDPSAFQIEVKRMELAITQLEDTLDDTYSRDLKAQLQLQLEIAQDELELYKQSVPYDGMVRAGFDGMVSEIYVTEGQSVYAGTTLFDLIKQGVEPRVRFSLPAEEASLYQVGSEVSLTYLKTHWEGGNKVTNSYTEKVAVTGKEYKDGQFLFYTDIDRAGDALLYAGMQVDVTAIASSYTYSLVIPLSAVSETPNGGLIIYVLETRDSLFGQETYVKELSIKEVAKNNISMAVSGEGVHEFLQVVVSTSRPISDGETVMVEG